jgi:PAS domain S-box-containing protein
MVGQDKVNILLVDDQPGKLLSYETILHGLNENLLKASSGREALEYLLKSDIAVILVDVCMPDLDGFQLAAMIRDHPRFQKTAIIFISAILLSEMDSLRGYEMGAVDYVPVPVVPEVLRAKVKVFAELYRKTRQLETLNRELEERVAARTAELERSTSQLLQSEQRRTLALAAGQMGSWEWDRDTNGYSWDDGQYRILGVDRETFPLTPQNIRALIHDDDWDGLSGAFENMAKTRHVNQVEFRIRRPDGQIRWCLASAAATIDERGRVARVSGVTFDITERKEIEEKQTLLAREVDHRAKNALALVQSILRLTRAEHLPQYINSVEGRIRALSRAHTVLSQSRWQGADLRGMAEDELAPYRTEASNRITIQGPHVMLQPAAAQTLALALHELATNAAKYGAFSTIGGRLTLTWTLKDQCLFIDWRESDGPPVVAPKTRGFGTRIIVASIEQQLRGRATLNWSSSGLQCSFVIPLNNSIEPSNSAEPELIDDEVAKGPLVSMSGASIMVVEDEALVALAVNDSLIDLGLCVVGPFSRVADARRVLQNTTVDAAILDVNLSGELVYPLADLLMARGIPFVFVTGYGAESIDRRFQDTPVLQKPIEKDVLRRLFIKSDTVDNIIPISAHN